MTAWRWARRASIALALACGAVVGAHLVVRRACVREGPDVHAPALTLDLGAAPDELRAGAGTRRTRHGIHDVRLEGAAAEIGAQHATLLRDRMVADEAILWAGFERTLSSTLVRTLVLDLSLLRYRDLERGFPDARRIELSAQAHAFAPDPYASKLPTYTRMALLHAAYDVALGFEGSPLLGCTSFAIPPSLTADGHALLARAFDFEVSELFDRDKVVYSVREEGRLELISVAWPGFVGVVSGMNEAGVAVVVHGGRAGSPSASGVPVAFSLREVLATARTTEEATERLAAEPVMVSHMVLVSDALGDARVVERAPGLAPHVRRTSRADGALALSNHFEGPLARDPANERVRAETTTLARRARADALLDGARAQKLSVPDIVAWLRDHECDGAPGCLLGDRRSIDATIAAHGIIADSSARVLWVSRGPRLSGPFVPFPVGELGRRNVAGLAPTSGDAILDDGRFEAARRNAGPPLLEGGKP